MPDREKPKNRGEKKFAFAGAGLFILDYDEKGVLRPIFNAGLMYADVPGAAVVAMESVASANIMELTKALAPIAIEMTKFGQESLKQSLPT